MTNVTPCSINTSGWISTERFTLRPWTCRRDYLCFVLQIFGPRKVKSRTANPDGLVYTTIALSDNQQQKAEQPPPERETTDYVDTDFTKVAPQSNVWFQFRCLVAFFFFLADKLWCLIWRHVLIMIICFIVFCVCGSIYSPLYLFSYLFVCLAIYWCDFKESGLVG